MKRIKALFFDLDENLLDGSALQESIVQTCKVIGASKSGLEARDLVEANKKIWPDYSREAEHKRKLGALDGASVGLEEMAAVRFTCADAATSHSLPSRFAHSRGLAEIVCSTTDSIVSPARQVGREGCARQCPPELADEFSRSLLPVGELVVSIPAPCCDHRKHQDPAFAEQLLIGAPVEPAHLFGHVGEIELDRSAATGLEVYEQQALLRPEDVARVWLAVQELFGAPAATDRLQQTS